MFIEDLLLPLQRDGADWMDKAEAANILESLLKSIESRPLSARERRLLKSTVIEFLTVSNLRGDVSIEAKFVKRFSYDYLPIAGSSPREPLLLTRTLSVVPKADDSNAIMEPSPMKRTTTLMTSTQEDEEFIPRDGTTSLDYSTKAVQESELADVLQEVPSGIQYICNIQRHRSTLSTSYRMYLEGTKGVDHKDDTSIKSPSSDGHHHIFLVGSRIRKGGMIQGCPLWSIADSKLWSNKNSIAKIMRMNSIYSMKLSPVLNPIISPSTSSTPVIEDNVVDDHHISSSSSSSTAADMNARGVNDVGQIAVSIRSKGIDKLIQMNAALTSNHVEEDDILSKLHAMTDVTRQHHLSSSSNASYLLLRNRLPVKTTSVKGKDIHAVDFGPSSRIRTPSRKNIVLEEIGLESNQWETSDGLPLFQLGKIEEDMFAVDFSRISPIQAFVLALAILDQ